MHQLILWLVLLTPTDKFCPQEGYAIQEATFDVHYIKLTSKCRAEREVYLERTKPDAKAIEAAWHGYYTVQVSSVVFQIAPEGNTGER